ncbi:MAG: glycosyltransferase [Myxococcaceae bacterium]|nr:glycosyltransferase [Myxococcaceae bacterium]
MPFRDAAATIDAALSGLLVQADDTREVLAIDDGSTDSGPARVRTWAARDRRVRLLGNSGRGLVAALQSGTAAARGGLIARMDADDIAHPERLERQRNHLLAHPELGVLGTRVRAVADDRDDRSRDLGEGLVRYVAWQNALTSPREHALARFVESPLCHPSIMLRRSLLTQLGGYRELDGPEDYELFLRALASGHQLAKLPEVLLDWRHRPGRATFGDPRYALHRFREVKAPYLAEVILQSGRERVALWGAGRTGKRLARALCRHGVAIARFIDVDPQKIGRSAQGAPIYGAAALDPQRDLVIAAVGARGARALIGSELQARGFVEGESYWFAS